MASGFSFAGTDLDSIFAFYHSGWPQAGITEFEIGGSDLRNRYATLSTGSAAATTFFKTSTGADLNTIFAAYGSTGVTVGTQPSAISGSAAAGAPSGTVTSNTTTCAAGPQGGPTKTYTWHIASGSGFSLTAPNSATTGVTGVIPAGQTVTGSIYCTIADGVTSTNSATVGTSLRNTTPPFAGQTDLYTTPGTHTETIPAGASSVVIETWAGGASGGVGAVHSGISSIGGGGGAGGYSRSQYSVLGHSGQTMTAVVGAGGAASTGVGNNGGSSSTSSGSFGITTLSANGGAAGQSLAGGVGGTATGGTQANTAGGSGSSSSYIGGTGAGGAPVAGNGGYVYGAGGTGGSSGGSSSAGLSGAVKFTYT